LNFVICLYSTHWRRGLWFQRRMDGWRENQ